MNVIFILISLGATGIIFYLSNWWQNLWWLFAVPPLLIAFYLAAFAVWIIALYVAALFVKKDPDYIYKPNRFAQWVIRQTAAVVLRVLRVKVHGSGFGKIPDGTPVVFINNHLSVFDEFAIVKHFRKPIVFISKPDNFRLPIAGAWMRYAGYIPIIQGDMASGTQVIRMAAKYLDEYKVSVCVAPEGTRNKNFPNPTLLPFHAGSFRLATESGKPVVVAALQNTNAVVSRFPRKTHVYLDIVSVVESEEYSSMTSNELATRCRNDILKRFEQKEARFYHVKPPEPESESNENNAF